MKANYEGHAQRIGPSF